MTILIIGFDGATFDLIRPRAAAGYLPNLARLMAEGVTADLASTLPPVTSPWLITRNPALRAPQDLLAFTLLAAAPAHRHHPAWTADSHHLAQCLHRVGQVLQHLMGVHHVETVVGQVERVHVARQVVDVLDP